MRIFSVINNYFLSFFPRDFEFTNVFLPVKDQITYLSCINKNISPIAVGRRNYGWYNVA